MVNLKCKIDSHIPIENGLRCQCGYFRKRVLNKYDIIEKLKETNKTIDTIQNKLKEFL